VKFSTLKFSLIVLRCVYIDELRVGVCVKSVGVKVT